LTLKIPGRMELVRKHGSKYFFIDYAHTPDAFNQVFSSIRKIKTKNKISCVFGCGGDRDSEKRSKMAFLAEKYCKNVFVTTDNPRYENQDKIFSDIVKGFKTNNYHIIEDRKDAIKAAIEEMDEDSVLLVLGKGRENYQIINESQFFFSDYDTIREIINES
ncbi:UDP-N-acetylmuramoyl-L-alanyl-D-glutamate--2,6-diaminopimelate ligase, partial [Candidatus Marinimicrobia bacterium]|nr:UDP-N-acetylmuramoyl-L-alanyl-D-glutamate--2,6-diaminopimelate ligase [Candidatus Neomarinimicrobiota bacterium]